MFSHVDLLISGIILLSALRGLHVGAVVHFSEFAPRVYVVQERLQPSANLSGDVGVL